MRFRLLALVVCMLPLLSAAPLGAQEDAGADAECSGDADSDEDGIPNCEDACPTDPNKSGPGVCGCFAVDSDSDEDGVLDCEDDCPDDAEHSRWPCGGAAPSSVKTQSLDDGGCSCRAAGSRRDPSPALWVGIVALGVTRWSTRKCISNQRQQP